jgi:hypothetical protein
MSCCCNFHCNSYSNSILISFQTLAPSPSLQVENYPKITISEYGRVQGDEAIMAEILARGPVSAYINAYCIEVKYAVVELWSCAVLCACVCALCVSVCNGRDPGPRTCFCVHQCLLHRGILSLSCGVVVCCFVLCCVVCVYVCACMCVCVCVCCA